MFSKLLLKENASLVSLSLLNMHVLTHTSSSVLIPSYTIIGYWKMEKICTSRMLLEDGQVSDSNVLLTTHNGGSECSNHACYMGQIT